MDPNEVQRQELIEIAQRIALQAIELPPEERPDFIQSTVATIRARYERKHGVNPSATKTAAKLQALTEVVMQILEEDGGQIGHG
jgi:hypothetical protein